MGYRQQHLSTSLLSPKRRFGTYGPHLWRIRRKIRGIRTRWSFLPMWMFSTRCRISHPEFKAATSAESDSLRISEGAIISKFESSRPFTITDYAMKSDKLHEHYREMCDDLVD